jgi:alanine racemase
VAKLLEFHRVDYLGVAYADEGIALRNAGVKLPVLVLNPERAGFDAMYRYRLEPEIYSHRVLDELIEYAGHERQIAIHLKVDTGMHRLGFGQADLPLLLKKLGEYPNLSVKSVFSHLSASDNTAHDAFTHLQAASFRAFYDALCGTGLRATGPSLQHRRHRAVPGVPLRHGEARYRHLRHRG